MTIHVLVEGPSERALLDRWIPRLLKGEDFRVHPHHGKGELPPRLGDRPDPKRRGLLDQLPAKLRGFATSKEPQSHSVVVLVDADRDDPGRLARLIAGAAKQVAPDLSVTVCLAIEEIEAFYLGDLKALVKAFPAADLEKARAYEPDSVCNTWELFGEIVGDGGANKVAWAEAMGPLLTTKAQASRSPSFKALVIGLINLKAKPTKALRRNSYRHPAQTGRTPDGRR